MKQALELLHPFRIYSAILCENLDPKELKKTGNYKKL
uniref:Uncharacterized protein n=1 Tax=Arundo donax TaxID=35708 RepID=A0A0A9B2E2_ARUDO